METSQRNVDVLFKALAQAIPQRVCAASQGTMNNITVGGLNPVSGKLWSFYETIGGGMGGRPTMDGLDGIHIHMTNTMNTPIEVAEKDFPMLFLKYELRKDSWGPGRWRGGLGIERSWMLLSPSATLSIIVERTKIPPWGLNKGKSGGLGEYWLKKANGRTVRLKSKLTIRMEQGDTLIIRTPGGGGYSDPLDREAELVLKDVLDGKVSLQSAYSEYGVIIERKTIKLNIQATLKLRKELKLGSSP